MTQLLVPMTYAEKLEQELIQVKREFAEFVLDVSAVANRTKEMRKSPEFIKWFSGQKSRYEIALGPDMAHLK